jgi:regulator of cell morphogenesis and NO signaling
MKISGGETVNSIITSSLPAARILAKHGIDFCTDGGKSLDRACTDAGVSVQRILKRLALVKRDHAETVEGAEFTKIDALTHLIERRYHDKIEDNIAFIKIALARLLRVHGRQHPEQEEINRIFEDLTARLTIQIQHEEFILFPYIREMVKQGRKVKTRFYKSVKSPIRERITDRDVDQEALRRLSELTHRYSASGNWSCNEVRVTYAAMREFEKELQLYLDLEETILFPKALELEASLNRATWKLSNAKKFGRKSRRANAQLSETRS